jgi:hypothetical protein
VIAAMQNRRPPADWEMRFPSLPHLCRTGTLPPLFSEADSQVPLWRRLPPLPRRGPSLSRYLRRHGVGEMQCLRDQRMNNGVNPQMGALHLLDGTFQNFKGNVAHSVSIPT